MIMRSKLFVAVIAAALSLSFLPAQAQLRPGDPGYITWLYSHTRASILDSVLQVRQFSEARAAGDETAMEIDAAELLAAITEARQWTTALDEVVTPGEFTPEIDTAIADLAALVNTVHDTLLEDLVAGDMEAIGQRMDESSRALNRLSIDLRRLRVLLVDYI